ncbi:MAG: TolC family protein [Polyangiaceae bacterium]|nr:TolC family protein [Polyangiaceae bacterium]
MTFRLSSFGHLALVFALTLVHAERALADRAAREDAALPAPAPRAMTLPEALAYAREHQPRIRAALARVSAERVQAEVPRGQWLPAVGLTAQLLGATSNNTTAGYVPFSAIDIPRIGGSGGTSWSSATLKPYASSFAAVGATQEIFDFGRIAAQSAAADALVEVRRHDADAERLDIEFDVEESFFAVQAAKGVLAAAEGAFERARVHRDLAEAGVRSGLRSPVELTRAEADLQRFETGRTRAHGGILVAQSVLAAAIGSPERGVDTAGPVQNPADMPALAAAIRRASERDPHVLATLAQLKAQEERTRAIDAELRPDLSATATISARAGGAPASNGDSADYAGWLPTVPNWDVGLVLTWPIFDGTISARKRASRALEDVRKDEIDVARQMLIARIEQTYVTVEVARATLPNLAHALDAAIANYTQADARFTAGLGTSVELADAEALRTSAEIDLALGTFELARARAAFGRAIAEGL